GKMRPAVKAIIVIVFTSTLIRCVCGANHTVGGASGWDIISNMQDWSSTTTFNVGDDLVFSYTPLYDVVEVNKQGYDTCTIANAIAIDNTGETVIHLTDNRTRYFVCGRMRHCKQGLKLKVQIQAQPKNNNNGTNNNQNQPGNGGQKPSPPPRNLPPRNAPPPSYHSPPSPPPDVPAEKPSGAEPLITPVIILAFAWLSWYFTVNHLMSFIKPYSSVDIDCDFG
ncbi:blue copper protein, partial [Trifolium pratense]